MKQLGKSNFCLIIIDRRLDTVTTKHLNGNGINLITILKSDKKNRLIKNEKRIIFQRKIFKK